MLLSELTGRSAAEEKQRIQKICYDGLVPIFKKIKPYHYAREAILSIKNAGYKIAILSDFPPEQKEDIWGIKELCDVCIGSEESGALKPSVFPFGILARKLNLEPSQILYVGNSHHYDVQGANNAGMKSAYILSGFKRLLGIKDDEADFSFKTYRQLEQFMLQ